MKLYNIAENLILETASRNNIMKCISDRRIAEVYYDDEQDPGGEGACSCFKLNGHDPYQDFRRGKDGAEDPEEVEADRGFGAEEAGGP